MKNYVKDNRSGKISTLVKNKPIDVPVKGRIKLELINAKTGEVDVEAKSENIFMNWPYENAYNGSIFTNVNRLKRHDQSNGSTSGTFTQVPSLLGVIRLTTNTLPEQGDCPLVLGKQIGWAWLDETYSGNSTLQGTINTAETRTYWNDEGQFVYSIVCDWPTHACNGTFQSIFITPSGDVNTRSYLHAGKLIYNMSTIPSEYKKVFQGDSSHNYGVFKHVYNETSNEVVLIGFNSYKGFHADYGRKINIFRFDYDTGAYKSFIQLKNADGSVLGAYYQDSSSAQNHESYSNNANSVWNFHPLSNGETINICYNGSKITRRTFNTEGIYKNDQIELSLSDIKDANGNSLSLSIDTSSYSYYAAAYRVYEDGTIHLYGSYNVSEGVYENVIIILDKDLNVLDTVYVNNSLYPEWVTSSPSATMWRSGTSNSRGNNIARFATGAGGFTYIITKEGKLKYLSDQSYSNGVINGDFGLSGFNGLNSNSNARQWYRYNTITTHTLLSSPVTKTQAHTMKVTYEVISEPTSINSTKNFTDFILEQN